MRTVVRHTARASRTTAITASAQLCARSFATSAVSSASRSISSSRLNPSSAASLLTSSSRSFSASASAGPVLILADHDNARLLESTLNIVTAAKKLGSNELIVLVLGHQSDKVAAEASKIEGVTRVIQVEDAAFAHPMAEGQSLTIAEIAKETKSSHILTSTSASGKNILPRVGAHLDVQPITEVIEIKSADTFVRPIYAGNAISTVQSGDAVKIMTVRPTSYERAAQGSKASPIDKKSAPASAACSSKWVSEELTRSARPSLSSARLVVAGGRGLKSKENFGIIEELADALGGAVGASRAAVDAGYVPNDYQVGQTGKVVAPDCYIAVGISGAIQHLAGMKDSKVIVAINKDKEAPIFQVADYGLEGDLFKLVPEMTKLVKEAKK